MSGKKRYIVVCLAVLAGLTLFLALGACTGAQKDPRLEMLATPENFFLDEDEILSWDAVEGANAYLVCINEKEYTVEETSFDTLEILIDPGTYRMSVMAVGKGAAAIDSEPTEEIEFTVATPALHAYNTDDGYMIFASPEAEFAGKLVLPPNAAGIYKGGFADCTEITSVYIPDNISSIGAGAFKGCTNLRRVRLPETCQEISSHAFAACTSLWDVSIPESVQIIGVGAFENSTSLKEIFIPANVTELQFAKVLLGTLPLPFSGSGLERITVAEDNPVYYSEGNCIFTRDGTLFEGCNGSVIPSGTKEIGEYAFFYCPDLKSIEIPESVEVIKSDAFSCCSNLQSVKIAEGVVEIERNAFSGCTKLTAIEIPKSVEKLDRTAFNVCDRLTSITVAEGNPVYYSAGNCIVLREGNVLFLGCSASVIPDGVEEIGESAFSACKISEVTIPSSVKKIGRSAFWKCSFLRSVRLPEGLETIGEKAFFQCDSFSLLIPASVTEIGSQAIDSGIPVFISHFWKEKPSGWDSNAILSLTKFWGCTFGYDGAYPYLISTAELQIDAEDMYNGTFLIGSSSYLYAPTRAGYTFAGWATEENGEVVYRAYTVTHTFFWNTSEGSSEKEVLITFDMYSEGDQAVFQELRGKTLYAVWIPNE